MIFSLHEANKIGSMQRAVRSELVSSVKQIVHKTKVGSIVFVSIEKFRCDLRLSTLTHPSYMCTHPHLILSPKSQFFFVGLSQTNENEKKVCTACLISDRQARHVFSSNLSCVSTLGHFNGRQACKTLALYNFDATSTPYASAEKGSTNVLGTTFSPFAHQKEDKFNFFCVLHQKITTSLLQDVLFFEVFLEICNNYN